MLTTRPSNLSLASFIRWCSALMLCTILTLNAAAQCTNTSAHGGMTAPAVVGGTSTASCQFAGDFNSLTSVVLGNSYQITSTVATDYITVRSDAYNGAVVAVGVQPLFFTAPSSGTYYVHCNTNASCGTQSSCRNLTITRIYTPCSGVPALGNAATTNAGPVCPAVSFNLSLNPTFQSSGVNFQWEVSTVGSSGPFTSINGQTNVTATITGQTQNSWYRLTGLCTYSGQSSSSGAVSVTQQAAANCYCTPTYQYNNQYGHIDSVKLGTINNVTGQNAPVTNNYYSYVTAPAANQTTDLAQGVAQTISIGIGGSGTYNCVTAWIDFNADGDFTDSLEQLGTASFQLEGNQNFTFTVPANAVLGPTRLRVREIYGYPVTDPCSYINSNGETEDYLVTIVEQTPCTGQSVAVSINANGPTTFCLGGSVVLTASGASSYLWSTGATTSSMTVSSLGVYGVTGTNQLGCTGSATPVTVTVNPIPEVSINAGGPTTFCDGGSVTLTASGASSYLWSNNATTSSIIATTADSYSVVGTSAEGCSSTSTPITVTVNSAPTVSINANGPLSFCIGGSVTLTASGATSYLWSNNATTTSITVSTSASYSVTGTNATGCTAAAAPTIVSSSTPPTVSIDGSLSFCQGGSTTLTASGASSYLWSNNATTSSIIVSEAGSYSVTGTSAGCGNTAGPISISANTPPTVTISSGSSLSFCLGGSVTLTASGAASYLWSNGATTTSITVSNAGSYSVTGTNAAGCTASSTPAVTSIASLGCYCIPSSEYGNETGYINSVQLGTINNTTGQNASPYVSFVNTPAANQTTNLANGDPYAIVIDVQGTTGANNVMAWIDFNDDGDFYDADEELGIALSQPNGAVVFTFTVPPTAILGTTRLRIRGTWYGPSNDPCAAFHYGEAEDYVVNILAPTTCSNQSLVTYITTNAPTTFCQDGSVTLTASGAASYAWSNGETTSSILVTTSGSYAVTGTSAGGCTTTAAPIAVTRNLCYCIPSLLFDNTHGFINAVNLGTINNTSGQNASAYVSYVDAPTASQKTDLLRSDSYTITINLGGLNNYNGNGNALAAWIDFNADGDFTDVGERIGNSEYNPYEGDVSFTFTVPDNALVGNTRLRVREQYYVEANMDPCATYYWGETEDYKVSIIAAPCTGQPPVTSITANGPTTFCQGGSVTLTASGAASYLWSNGATTTSITVSSAGSYFVTGTSAGGCTVSSAPTSVSVNPLPSVTIAADGNTSFCQDGSVTLTASGASTYLWSNNATTTSITVSTQNTYTVVGTGADGCSSESAPTSVVVNPLPIVTIGADGPLSFCEGGSVTLNAFGASSYLWSNNATATSITISSNGTFSVVGTSVNGCATEATPVTASVNTLPTVSIDANGPTTFCQDGSVTLTASGASAYTWSTGATTSSIVASTNNTYSVTGTSNDCISTPASIDVTVNTPPTVVINADGPTSFCEGGFVTLTASGASSYLWSNNATTTSITVSQSGSYSVVGTSANNCSSASQPTNVEITGGSSVSINANGPTTFCLGGSVVLTASGASSFTWSNGATTTSITVTNAGSYSVTGTSAGGCSGVSTPVVVSVNDAPTASIDGLEFICTGASTQYCATAASSYLWSNGATTQCITVSTAATYNVTITNENGCTATSSRTLALKSLPICEITGNETICPGGSSEFCSPSFNTIWSNGVTGSCITVSSAATYNVTITHQNGCTSSCSRTLTVATLPTCTLTAPTVLPTNGSTNNTLSVTSNGVSRVWTLTSSNNSWLIVGSNTGTSVNYTAGTVGTTGTFTVVTTSANGCTDTCSVTFGSTTATTTGAEYCSKAQGFYGGKGKTCTNQTPTQALNQALSSGSIVLGDGLRKLTILPSQVSCVIAKMPSGTTPAVLPLGDVTCTNAIGTAYLNNGKFKSVLLGQTLALALNIRLNAALGTVVIANKYMTTYAASACVNGVAVAGTKQVFAIPQSVLTFLGTTNTVNDLLLLANKGLGGTYIPGAGQPSLGDITSALDAINRGFDGCRILAGFSANSSGLKLDSESEAIEVNAIGMTVSAYPNPFTGNTTVQFTLDETNDATLEVYSVTGQRVALLFNGVANAGETYEAAFDATGLAAGMYLCKLSTTNNAVVHKVILMK